MEIAFDLMELNCLFSEKFLFSVYKCSIDFNDFTITSNEFT